MSALRIGYLTGRYPEISHTFVLREVQAVRALGIEVDTFSIWRTDSRQLLASADREEFDRTYAMLPPSLRDFAAAHLRALTVAPLAWLRVLIAGYRLGAEGTRGRALGVLWAIEAVLLWDLCRLRGIRHVHVHINGTAPAVALLCARFGRAADGDDWTYSMAVHGSNEFFDVVRERLSEKITNARFVVCISDFTRSQLMRLVPRDQWHKLRIVHCGVDPRHFDSRPPTGGSPDRLHVLGVGRLVRGKGYALLVEAIAALDRRGIHVTAEVVGDGPDRTTLERLARELGVADRVRFTGSIGQDQITTQYRRADVFCLPSFAEGVPVVLMEAMAMRLPVITTNLMGIPELVEDGVSGVLLAPGRADQLADALAELAADPAKRREMGEAGRAKVLADFDVARSARQLQQLFLAMLRPPSAGDVMDMERSDADHAPRGDHALSPREAGAGPSDATGSVRRIMDRLR